MKIFKARLHAFKVALLLLAFPLAGHAITTDSGKTFFTPPPLGMLLEPVYGQFRDFAARNEPADRFTLTAAPFYIESTNPKNLRRTFMPEGKDELVIKGGNAVGDFDVSATWLKIAGTSAAPQGALMHNDFSSRLTMQPSYSMYGAAFGLHKKIGCVFIQATMPIAEVQTSLGLREFIEGGNVASIDDVDLYQTPGGGNMQENPNILYSTNATEALGQDLFKFNKLSSSPLKASGIGDVALRVGLAGEFGELFVCGVLPTSKRSTNAYAFEPLLGNGSHLGLGAGAALQLGKHLEALDAQLSLRGELDYTYLFENNQVRTFDLSDKGPLSRYLQFKSYDIVNVAGYLPAYAGVNILSKKCAVSPEGSVHLGLQAGIQKGKILCKLRYQFAHQQQENIRVKEGFDKVYAIGHTSADDRAEDANLIYPTATIGTHGDSQAHLVEVFTVPLSIEHLDLASATRPASSMSSGVVSVGFEDSWYGAPSSVGLFSGVNFDHAPGQVCSWVMGLQSTLNF